MDAAPSRKTITVSQPHACIINALLDETIQKLELLALIASDAKNRGHQKRSTTDMHTLLQRRAELEKRYGTLMERRNQLRGLVNKKAHDKNQEELRLLADQLRGSINNISQNLSESNNPHLAKNLVKVEKDRFMLTEYLRLTRKELGASSSFDFLRSEVDAQLGEINNLSATKKKRSQIRNDVKEIESLLQRETELFEKDVKSRDDEILSLTSELQHLKVETEMTLKYEENSAQAKANMSQRLRNKKMKAMDGQLRLYQQKLDTDSKVSIRSTNFLHSRQEEMTQKIAEWTAKYKKDMKEMTIKLDDLHEKRDLEKTKLDALRAQKLKDQKEMEMRAELQRTKAKRLAQRRVEEKKMFLAAAKIRFFWQIAMKKEAAGGKKKKGKKKKK
uniref:Dynein regulatory complex protein 9 n=1 Tax=Lotharella globosa TaxID=91324 RepID=A0A7S3ZI23_9EUKA|mmetsp:Transcript_5824/g.11544  ORF Transcript_5824/g.11544 Transcript_5824/m.11544 type:complete len:389 (+) Transcript_5824:69-1235(+)